MKKSFRILLNCFSVIMILACLCFFACSEKNGNITLNGLDDVKISVDVRGYDFSGGIVFTDADGKGLSFEVDSSAVKFGTAGEYTVTYTVGGKTEVSRKVLIYGKPSIERVKADVSYQAVADKDFSESVKASDTFGKALKLELISALEYGLDGALVLGNNTFSFKTTDALGNETVQDVELNVKAPTDAFDFNKTFSVDYAKPYVTLALGDRRVESVNYNGETLEDGFIFNNGYLMIKPSVIQTIGVGSDKALKVNCNTGYFTLTLNITDNQPVSYSADIDLSGEEFYFDDVIRLPRYSLESGSIQEVGFEYFLQIGNGVPFEYADAKLYPAYGGNYSFITKIYKGGELSETETQNFFVSHFCEKILPIYEYIALGEENDLTVVTDLTDIDVRYEVANNENGTVELDGYTLTGLKEGTVSVTLYINDEEVESVTTTVFDFGKKVGKKTELSKDLSVWRAYNGGEFELVESQDDNTGAEDVIYSFDALSGSSYYLKNGLVDAAKSAGYKYLVFYYKAVDNFSGNADFGIYTIKGGDVVGELISLKNANKWTRLCIDLADVNAGEGLLFRSSGESVSIADAHFVGADISEYAATIITPSATAGKSNDLVRADLIGSMFKVTCNDNNTLTYYPTGAATVSTSGSAIGEGDYYAFTREGYYRSYGTTLNTIYIDSEWIQAAKKLGYSLIGIWANNCTDYSYVKYSLNETIGKYATTPTGAEWHGGATKAWGFISLDLTSFEDGDVLVLTLTGGTVDITGITFRKGENFTPNLVVKD